MQSLRPGEASLGSLRGARVEGAPNALVTQPPLPSRRAVPGCPRRQADMGGGTGVLPGAGCGDRHHGPALCSLGWRPGPLQPGLAGRWQRALPHRDTQPALRGGPAWCQDALPLPQPDRLSQQAQPLQRLLLPR